MEVKEYLRHDYKARTHPRLQRIMMRYGMEGVGLYWCLIEMMYEQDGELLLSECETYAFALRMDAERIATFVKESGAFEIEDDQFYSTTVTERLLERDEKSKKAKKSANVRWNKQKDANAMRTHTKRNASIVEDSIKQDRIVEKEEVGTFAKIEGATDYLQLIPIWTEYRKTKGQYPTLYEIDVLQNAWARKSLPTLKKEMLKAIENGWKSLVEDRNLSKSATSDPTAPAPKYHQEFT